MKTLVDLVLEGIESYGADGLCNERLECGCAIGDLMPCGDPQEDCVIARIEGSPGDGFDFLCVPMDQE